MASDRPPCVLEGRKLSAHRLVQDSWRHEHAGDALSRRAGGRRGGGERGQPWPGRCLGRSRAGCPGDHFSAPGRPDDQARAHIDSRGGRPRRGQITTAAAAAAGLGHRRHFRPRLRGASLRGRARSASSSPGRCLRPKQRRSRSAAWSPPGCRLRQGAAPRRGLGGAGAPRSGTMPARRQSASSRCDSRPAAGRPVEANDATKKDQLLLELQAAGRCAGALGAACCRPAGSGRPRCRRQNIDPTTLISVLRHG